MQELNTLITDAVETAVRPDALYRAPLIGFARADDPHFADLKRIVGPGHCLPADLLPGARSVVSFFVPFTRRLVRANQRGPVTTPEWGHAKKSADDLIDTVVRVVSDKLAPLGVAVSGNPALGPFDSETFLHSWSQKHVAHICGLGTFGLNQLIITAKGCAGRFGSFVIDAETAPTPMETEPACRYKFDRSCGVCVRKCPSKALGFDGLQKDVCSAWLATVTKTQFAGVRAYSSCGKCIALPCALKRPRPG